MKNKGKNNLVSPDIKLFKINTSKYNLRNAVDLLIPRFIAVTYGKQPKLYGLIYLVLD